MIHRILINKMVHTVSLSDREKQKIIRLIDYNKPHIYDVFINNGQIQLNVPSLSHVFREISLIVKNTAVTCCEFKIYIYSLEIIQIDLEDQCNIIEQMKEAVLKFKGVQICKCGTIYENTAFDICQDCHVLEMNMKSKCPVCLENGTGIWVENICCDCKYSYHRDCVLALTQCPTCRGTVQYEYL